MALTKISTDGVKDDAVTAGKIPANAVGSSELADNAVDTAAIADDAVTDAKIASQTITGASIANDAITSALIADNTIQATNIAAGAIGGIQIADNTLSLAKLEHGSSSQDGKFLRANNGADPSFETVSIPAGTTINNNADNRVITGSGTANTLEGEQYLTWNGSTLGVQKSGSGDAAVNIEVGNGISQSRLLFSDNSAVDGTVTYDHNARKLHLGAGTSSPTDGDIIIDSSGKVGIGTSSPNAHLHVYKAHHYVPTDSGKATGGIHVRGANGNNGEMGGAISFSCGDEASSAAIAARQGSQDASVTGLSIFTHPSTDGNDDAEEKVRIHADGRIQPKYSSSAGATGGIMTVGAFNAKLNGHTGEGILQAVTNAGHATTFDAAGWYDNSNYRHVPQVKGYYFYQVTMMFFTGMSGHAVEQSFQIRLNNSTVHGFTDGYSSNYGNYSKHSFHGIIRCNGNSDYVDVHCSSSRSVQIHSASAWTGYLLYPDS